MPYDPEQNAEDLTKSEPGEDRAAREAAEAATRPAARIQRVLDTLQQTHIAEDRGHNIYVAVIELARILQDMVGPDEG